MRTALEAPAAPAVLDRFLQVARLPELLIFVFAASLTVLGPMLCLGTLTAALAVIFAAELVTNTAGIIQAMEVTVLVPMEEVVSVK